MGSSGNRVGDQGVGRSHVKTATRATLREWRRRLSASFCAFSVGFGTADRTRSVSSNSAVRDLAGRPPTRHLSPRDDHSAPRFPCRAIRGRARRSIRSGARRWRAARGFLFDDEPSDIRQRQRRVEHAARAAHGFRARARPRRRALGAGRPPRCAVAMRRRRKKEDGSEGIYVNTESAFGHDDGEFKFMASEVSREKPSTTAPGANTDR